MKNNKAPKNSFYIGWQEKAPGDYAARIKKFTALLLLLVPLTAVLLVLSQRGFEASVFEFGELTSVEGVLVKSPVPMLKTEGPEGKQSILLVGFGKMGAGRDLQAIEEKMDKPLEGATVKLKGTRIYHDGKMLLELTEGPEAFDGFSKLNLNPGPGIQEDYGFVTLRGEIYDPKCAFGVMKPGYGKPHRSCAVRCISGGIPPVLKVQNAAGEKNYCLLLGSDGEPVNAAVLEFVADQVQVCGRLQLQDDWLVLRTDPASDILRLQPHWLEGELPLCVEQ